MPSLRRTYGRDEGMGATGYWWNSLMEDARREARANNFRRKVIGVRSDRGWEYVVQCNWRKCPICVRRRKGAASS